MEFRTITSYAEVPPLRALFGADAATAPEIVAAVQRILAEVQREGEAACLRFTQEFDGVALSAAQLEIAPEERARAKQAIAPELLTALETAAANIRFFHERQRAQDWRVTRDGVVLEQRYRPLARVGMYIPGGRAKYPSTVLMTAIPAQLAGVEEIIMVSPPERATGTIAPVLLAAAELAGVQRSFRLGGAQAIAALAYGTAQIPAVDKIVGPGNAYVAEAKRQVYGRVGIDLLAGPTEVVLLIDDSVEAAIVAQDLFAQMEHDPATRAAVLATDAKLLRDVIAEAERALSHAPRAEILRQAWERSTFFVHAETALLACAAVNALAPEHLQIMTRAPRTLLPHIQHAGAIFLGRYTPVAMGDYCAGPNHTLPTSGTARFASPLGVHDFMRQQHVVEYDRAAWAREREVVAALAEAEQLLNHARSARQR